MPGATSCLGLPTGRRRTRLGKTDHSIFPNDAPIALAERRKQLVVTGRGVLENVVEQGGIHADHAGPRPP